jgi:hypothetical protein
VLRDHFGMTGTKIGCDRGRVRCLHGPAGWKACLFVQQPCGLGRWPVRANDRGSRAEWTARSIAASIHRA